MKFITVYLKFLPSIGRGTLFYCWNVLAKWQVIYVPVLYTVYFDINLGSESLRLFSQNRTCAFLQIFVEV